jgi:hypothetical protein
LNWIVTGDLWPIIGCLSVSISLLEGLSTVCDFAMSVSLINHKLVTKEEKGKEKKLFHDLPKKVFSLFTNCSIPVNQAPV